MMGSAKVWTSSNLTAWTEQTAGSIVVNTDIWNNTFVGSGYNGEIVTSTGGVTWTKHETNNSQYMKQVAYNGSLYIAVGYGGTILTSSDLQTWSRDYPIGTSADLWAVASNGSKLAAVGITNNILTSEDGKAWTSHPIAANQLMDIAYGNGKFVGVGVGTQVYYSSDGDNWLTADLGTTNYTLSSIVYGDGQFVAVGSESGNYTSGIVFTSPDGINWTVHSALDSGVFPSKVAYGAGVYVFAAQNSSQYASKDGVNWTKVGSVSGKSASDVRFVNGKFYIPMNNAEIYVSSDPTTLSKLDELTWSIVQLNGFNSVNAIEYSDNIYVLVTFNGDIYSTTDFAVWTKRASFTAMTLKDVAVINGRFVAVGDKGIIVRSGEPKPPATYTIETIADQTFDAVATGYASGTQETKTVTIKRTGTGDLTGLAVALTGTEADHFTITNPLTAILNNSANSTTFTVKAKDGLTVGTHTATITVSADKMTAVTFTVTQVVKPMKGDVNGDGQVTPADALYISRSMAGSITLTELQKDILDMNDDEKLDSDDIKIIMNLYLGVPSN
jgi:hypothetical protein